MALQKQSVPLNFKRGLDKKTDPLQVALGNFLVLENQVFDVALRLTKRNGFGPLSSLPDSSFTFLTTFNNNLTAIGPSFQAFAQGSKTWSNKGPFTALSLSTLPLVKTSLNQLQADSASSPNRLICTAYTESDGTNTSYKFVIADSLTGQNILNPAPLPPSAGTVTGPGRVFLLANYFIIVFTATISAADHLQYIAININTLVVSVAQDISTTYESSTTGSFDGVVANNNLYLAWNVSSSGGIDVSYLDSTLTQHGTVNADASHQATLMSVCADTTQGTAVIWVSYYDVGTQDGYSLALNQQLTSILAPTSTISAAAVLNLTSAAQNQTNQIFYEIQNTYGFDISIPTYFISTGTITQAGVASSPTVFIRSLGLASKAFIFDSTVYVAGTYSSAYQPTYFVLNEQSEVVAKLAYSNGGGYLTTGLPSMQVIGNSAQFPYLFKDLVEAVNKDTAVPAGTQTAGVYSQLGINLATFVFGTDELSTAETASNLHLTGGFLWMYDGFKPVEHNFFLWPDMDTINANLAVTWSTTGGNMAAQPDDSTNDSAYFYQVTYEWTDSQGNPFRSAPSIPIAVTTTGTGITGSVTLNVPTLRLTYKTDIKIVIYRWSVKQQIYYQVTSISAPTLNNPSADSITFVDTLPDSTILGNNILYTTGGVVENIGAPAFTAVGLFNARLFGIDAEDPSLLWFSKQVQDGTPVEMSDLLTYFVNPSQGSQGPTGPAKCLFPMDDKFIIFKKGALEYITGQGPDITGNNSDFPLSPTFITSAVGCENQKSIVFTPRGLMFEAKQGIWLLGRDLSTGFIGAPVETFTQGATILAALNIPGTNQIRFTLSSGITLMYDYYFDQWGVFSGIPGISSTLYGDLHTYINASGAAFQETPGVYLDGTNPVNRRFTTSWVAPGGIQGYQRAYACFLLGTYLSPHKIVVGIAYDFDPAVVQQVVITPDNFAPAFGEDANFGSGNPFGGPSQIEQWQVNFKQQSCESFQLTFTEQYDPHVGPAAGAGFALSSLELLVGVKKTYPRTLPATRKVG